ncbi:MAG: AmmeMemoRadiSam system protein B [Candidatus Micrarchaeaceae archaeon]
MNRRPAVSGLFYPSDPAELAQCVENMVKGADNGANYGKIVSCVAPHAGYVYSGSVAARTYAALKRMDGLGSIDTFVVIGPNHTGLGYPISVSVAESWATPLGKVRNDVEFAEFVSGEGGIALDESAHRSEHSVEVQLPFLQVIAERFNCVFVCMGDQSYGSCKLLERSVSKAAEALRRRILVIASSDFNHYESIEIAKRKDLPAIKLLERLDAIGFHRTIEASDDSACGYGPVTVAALYAKRHGAENGKLLEYSTSGSVTGDYSSVVAYSSIVFF